MKLPFYKYDPSGNTTVFVDNRAGVVPRTRYASLAAELMKKELLCAEQVGYWEKPDRPAALGRLQMMGGEFCGNATRCFAKLLCDCGQVTGGWNKNHRECTVPVEVSGYPHILYEKVSSYTPDLAYVTGAMPAPLRIEELRLPGLDGPVSGVVFDGILHLIVEDRPCQEETVDRIRAAVYAGGAGPEALGILFYDREQGTMTPAVYVPAVGSLVYENSCGSGSVAVAALCAQKTGKDVRLTLRQPGGVLDVSMRDGAAELGGWVELRCKGEVRVEDDLVS